MSGFRKLAPLVLPMCLSYIFNGEVNANEKGPEFSRVVVMEEDDVILPCSLTTKEDIEFKLFDWRKDGQKEVFSYDASVHSNNGRSGQDKQFKGRVSHFSHQLKNGVASIKIQNMKLADSGNYTCDFPHLQPSQTFHIELVVEGSFKDRSAKIDGPAPKPHVMILDATKDWALLQCDVQGAFPKPKVEWKDRAGNVLRADEKISYRGERYNITLLTTVNKSDHYHCVVKQEEIFHLTEDETFVFIYGRPTGLIVTTVLSILLNVVLVLVLLIFFKKGRRWHEKGSGKPPRSDHENGVHLRTEHLLSGSDVSTQTSPV